MTPFPITITTVDLDNPKHGEALLSLLDHYAQDPMGGGQGLSEAVKARLLPQLAQTPHYYGALAWQGTATGTRAVGLMNCFFGFSTFAAAPLLNVHDIVVHRDLRGQGIAQALLSHGEAVASHKGCCKLTLEVLSNNQRALLAYERAGFKPYVLDPAAGQALFLQKKLLP